MLQHAPAVDYRYYEALLHLQARRLKRRNSLLEHHDVAALQVNHLDFPRAYSPMVGNSDPVDM